MSFIVWSLVLLFDLFLVITGLFEPHYWHGNRDVGYGYVPNRDDYIECADYPGGKYRVVTNSWGLKEFQEPQIPFEGIRVLFLRDSHMEGSCSNTETISDQFERFVNNRSFSRVDVQNVSISNCHFTLRCIRGTV